MGGLTEANLAEKIVSESFVYFKNCDCVGVIADIYFIVSLSVASRGHTNNISIVVDLVEKFGSRVRSWNHIFSDIKFNYKQAVIEINNLKLEFSLDLQ